MIKTAFRRLLATLICTLAPSCGTTTANPSTAEKPQSILRSFSLNRVTGNQMAENSRNEVYYYAASKKLVVTLTDRGIDEKITLTPEQFAEIEAKLLPLISKYKLKEWKKPAPPEFYATDEINSFSIRVYYRNGDEIHISDYPSDFPSIMKEVAAIFEPYTK